MHRRQVGRRRNRDSPAASPAFHSAQRYLCRHASGGVPEIRILVKRRSVGTDPKHVVFRTVACGSPGKSLTGRLLHLPAEEASKTYGGMGKIGAEHETGLKGGYQDMALFEIVQQQASGEAFSKGAPKNFQFLIHKRP